MVRAAVRLFVVLITTMAFLAACNPAAPGGTPNIALFDITSGKVAVHPGDPAIDFGTAFVLGSVLKTRTFSVENTGTGDLVLTGSGARAVITGDTANFSIPTQPPATIPAGGSANFDVVLTATTIGGPVTRNATIGIASDDPDLASLSFNVTGTDQYS